MSKNVRLILAFVAVALVFVLIGSLEGTIDTSPGRTSVWSWYAFKWATVLDGPLHALGLKGSVAEVDLFEKRTWTWVMMALKLTLALGSALFLMLEARARAFGEPFTNRLRVGVAAGVVIISFFAYFDFLNPNTRYNHYYHRHEYFHYYLGSKYFSEIGYERLYECSAIAEMELGRAESVKKRDIRDLRVNLIKKIKNTYVVSDPGVCKNHFSKERWEMFKKEVDFFYESARGSYYEGMIKDHGYNPPPVWTMEGKFVGSLLSVNPTDDFHSKDVNGDGVKDYRDFPHHAFFKTTAAIDVVLQGLMFVLLWWAFGWRVTMVAAVMFGASGTENFGFYWTGGAFLRMDWIFFLVAALALAKKRWFWAAGAALMWSGLLRVFPMILFYGWTAMVLIAAVRSRGSWLPLLTGGKLLPAARAMLPVSYWKLIGGATIALAVLVPASMVYTSESATSLTGLLQPYADFKHHISVHKDTPLTNQMGLETALVHDWNGRMRFSRDNNLDDPFQKWKEGRTSRARSRSPLQLAIAGFFALWAAWGLRRSKHLWLGIPLALPLVMCLTNLTCYYYVMFIAAAAIVAVRPGFAPAMLLTAAASHVFVRNQSMTFVWIDDRYAALSWLFLIFSAIILYAYSRPFSVERLKAWWHNRPEPNSVISLAWLRRRRELAVSE